MAEVTEAASAAPVLDDWMSRDDLSQELGVSTDTLCRWETQRRGPPCIRIGKRVMYRRASVRDWLVKQEERKTGAARR